MSTMTSRVATSSRQAVVDSSIGELTLVADDAGLTGVYFPQHWTSPDRSAFGPVVDAGDDEHFRAVSGQLAAYLAGDRRAFALPLNPRGSDLARRVWGLLAGIPYGQTATYGALAREIGGGISPRAIGGFVGRNPLSIIVPCHRVVGSTGQLTGYAGGLERKRHLLELEGALPGSAPALW